MKTKVFKLRCQQTTKGTVVYFLDKCLDIHSNGSSASGGLGSVRISRRTASMLLGWENVDRIGTAPMLASVVTTTP